MLEMLLLPQAAAAAAASSCYSYTQRNTYIYGYRLPFNGVSNYCLTRTSTDICIIGSELCWVESVRYLGVFIIRSYHFSCSFDNAKNLSTEVLMQSLVKLAGQHLRMHLIKSKCIPILL